jgi:hypothetical protein
MSPETKILIEKSRRHDAVPCLLPGFAGFWRTAGISPENPYGTPPESKSNSVDVVALIDHHGAKLYRVDFSKA